ncbi:MAG: DM13 domain-containing protein [Bacteroidia bacterium]|nr:DM13 domain-containing protein [Bacteroidia bacterium]
MKILFQLLFCTLLLTACKKETQTTNAAAANATVVRTGIFVQNSHKASGTVKVTTEQGFRKLYFENFATDAGANVHIYLSKDATNSDFKDLGGLQAISGNQVYQIDNNTDLNLYKFVLIWNMPTSELYGYAELK